MSNIRRIKAGSTSYDLRSKWDVEYVVDERTSAAATIVVTSEATQIYEGMHLCIRLLYDTAIPLTLRVNLADGTSTPAGGIVNTASSTSGVAIPRGFKKAGEILDVTYSHDNLWVINDFTEMIKLPTATDDTAHSIAFRATAQSSNADSNQADGLSTTPKIKIHPTKGILAFDGLIGGAAAGYSMTSHGQSIESPFQAITMSNKFLRYNGTITPNSGTLNVGTFYSTGNSNFKPNLIITESYGSTSYTWMPGDWLIDSSLNVFQRVQFITVAVVYRGKLNIDLSNYVTSSDLTTALADYVTTTYLITNYSTTTAVQTMIDAAIGNAIGASY